MSIFLGLILKLVSGRNCKTALDFRESSIVVLLAWILINLFSSIPYLFISGLSFPQACFEAVSGWTTTGLSVLDLNRSPHLLLFFRAWTQFLGGAGITIIVIASLTGVNANQLYSAEGKGYLIKPNVIASARIVMILNICYLVYGFIAYIIFGMTPFDALLHSFTAISTGGFGNYSSSIGFFNSPPIELITLTLMIMGNLNFVTAYLISKGRWAYVFRNGEIKIFTLFMVLSIPMVYLFSAARLYAGLGRQLRIAIFETASALTTTGFSLTNYSDPFWPDASIFVLIVLMLVGGGACSTAGGIKQFRVYLMLKSIFWQIRRSILPRNAVQSNYVWEGEQKEYVNDGKLLSTANFVVLYLFFYALGVMVIAGTVDPGTGEFYSLRNAMFEMASSLGTVGLSVGVTNLQTPVHITWLQILAMFLGRLEFFVVFIAVAKLWNDLRKKASCLLGNR
ncbi:MAG: TrkH family potassium uptake protein [Candidatus Cloacimonadaceae bacterium]|nr:TrkH family potassium uptake protein [Candidatus Cloacimonadaceae bacterium]